MSNDFRQLRRRYADLRDDLDSRPRDEAMRSREYVGQVYDGGAIPTTVPKVFLTHPVTLIASETEGGAKTPTANTAYSVPVVVLGPGVPVAGDVIRAKQVESYWVAHVAGSGGGGGGVTIPGCLCSITPASITMTVTGGPPPPAMFVNATITYQPVPPGLSGLLLGTNAYLSDDSYEDPDTGDFFRYYMTCSTAVYSLSRVYETSLFGSPFKDILRYLWLVGNPGNTCVPWSMANGTIYVGGDPGTVVTLSG